MKAHTSPLFPVNGKEPEIANAELRIISPDEIVIPVFVVQ